MNSDDDNLDGFEAFRGMAIGITISAVLFLLVYTIWRIAR